MYNPKPGENLTQTSLCVSLITGLLGFIKAMGQTLLHVQKCGIIST